MATWPERWPESGRGELSVLDRERDRLVTRLRTECTEGRISLDQFSDLVGDVYAARTRDDLERLTTTSTFWSRLDTSAVLRRDQNVGGSRARPAVKRASQWVVAVFGSSVRKGRYRLDEDTIAAAVFGDCTVDLTDATIEGDEVVITAVAAFGNVTVIVPDGIEVSIEGASIFGSRRCDIDNRDTIAGSPVVVVRAWAVFGDVRVRTPRRSRR